MKRFSLLKKLKVSAVAAALSLSVIPHLAMPVFAEDVTPTVATKQERMEARKDNTMTRLKQKADKEIDRRIERLNGLVTKINGVKRLSADQKTTLTSQVQTEITNLTSLKAKVDADTDLATLRIDVQSIVKDYRIFALFIPKIYIIAHADRILDIAEDASANLNFQTLIDKAKLAGADVAAAQTAEDDRKAKIGDAQAQAQSAINAVTPLTPDGYPANKTTLQSARTMLVTARQDLQAALKDGQKVRQLLKGFRETKNTKEPESSE